jgi:1-acylglycerone phosphate reductase
MAPNTTSTAKPSLLITGCSEGGNGAALAIAFHNAGYHVYTTAWDTNKMKHIQEQGIQAMKLDVLSAESIAESVKQVPSLDMLLNNAGRTFLMPIVDVDIA